jgi:hypothetical protein
LSTGPRRYASLLQLLAFGSGLGLLAFQYRDIMTFVRAIDHGELLFADFVFHYYPTVERSLREGAPAGGFFYPAAFATLIAPLGAVSLDTARVLWGAVLLVAALVSVFLLPRLTCPRHPGLWPLGTLLGTTSAPLMHNLKWGQVSILLLVLGAVGFRAYATRPRNLSALLLALATGIKGYPIVTLAYFAFRRDVRACLKLVAAFGLVLCVMPAIVMGPRHALFFQRVATQSVVDAGDGVVRDHNSQFMAAVISRHLGGRDWTSSTLHQLFVRGGHLLLALIVVLIYLLARGVGPKRPLDRVLLAFVLFSSSVPFWLRTSWAHYFVHLPMAQLLLWRILWDLRRAWSRASAIGLVLPSMLLSNMAGVLTFGGWFHYARLGAPFFSNALLLLATSLIMAHATFVRRRGLKA